VPQIITVAVKQKIAETTGNHISSLSDFNTAKLCPRRSQLRESVSMRFSKTLEKRNPLCGESRPIDSLRRRLAHQLTDASYMKTYKSDLRRCGGDR